MPHNMERLIQSGRNSGKNHWFAQYIVQAAREHMLETGEPFVALVYGMMPGKPEIQVKVTYEIVKIDADTQEG